MKRSLIGLATVVLVIAWANVAQAKGAIPAGAQMSGPGLKGTLTFGDPTLRGGTDSDGDINLLAADTKLLETLFEGDQTVVPKPADLGPRYDIVWTMVRGMPGHGRFHLHSDLYPYAKGGIFVHTEGGQHIQEGDSEFTLRSGWAAANPTLKENLRAWGLPRAPRAAATEGATSTTTAPSFWIIPLALLVLIIGVGFRAKRRTTTVRTA